MTDPSLAMQGAIVAALKASVAVTALIGGPTEARIFDRVPEKQVFPYIAFGPAQVIQQDATCIDGSEVYQQIDVWSRLPGFPECKRVAEAVREALHRLDATFGDLGFEIEHQFTNYLRDPDGLTSHAVLSFRAEIDQSDG